jgi:hypothetical protein
MYETTNKKKLISFAISHYTVNILFAMPKVKKEFLVTEKFLITVFDIHLLKLIK